MNQSNFYNFQEKGLTIYDLKSKRVAVLGFGIEGESAARYLVDKTREVRVFDKKNKSEFDEEIIKELEKRGVKFEFGDVLGVSGFDVVVRSPGIHIENSHLSSVRERGGVVTSVTKLFFDLSPTQQIIGVTGTKGKGTTSTLIYKMLEEEGEDVYLGGNIGESPLEFIEKLSSDSWVVLELSSFQLHDLHKSPHIGVMLMTTQEHLDYHKDIHEYIDAKRNIFRYQKEDDFAIVNQDYPASNESDIEGESRTYKVSRESEVFEDGCFVKGDSVVIKSHGQIREIVSVDKIALVGKHNLENVCAAVMAATLAGVSVDSIRNILKTFKGLEHRIESVATVRGVTYYDDSFSTTPETAIAAIEAFDKPKILILGGSSKESDFSELGDVISSSNSVKAIIGIGEEWPKIKLKIKNERLKIIEGCKTMHEVVEKANDIAEVGDVVLLSPACASFGMFKNYKERGNEFKREVLHLLN